MSKCWFTFQSPLWSFPTFLTSRSDGEGTTQWWQGSELMDLCCSLLEFGQVLSKMIWAIGWMFSRGGGVLGMMSSQCQQGGAKPGVFSHASRPDRYRKLSIRFRSWCCHWHCVHPADWHLTSQFLALSRCLAISPFIQLDKQRLAVELSD